MACPRPIGRSIDIISKMNLPIHIRPPSPAAPPTTNTTDHTHHRIIAFTTTFPSHATCLLCQVNSDVDLVRMVEHPEA
jgi:hypothetical protein